MIYVCSDIHGCGSRFYEMLKEIDFKDTDTLYILGDLIDRNNDSLELLKYVMGKKNIVLLMGNHEDLMYSYLARLNILGKLDIQDNFPNDNWLSDNNGGLVTLKDFIKEPFDVKLNILKYLSELPLICIVTVNGVKYHLSHSGTLPNVLDKEIWYLSDMNKAQRQIITWGSPFREDTYLPLSYYNKDCVNIFGHVPVQKLNDNYSFEILCINNIINIDSGCAMFKLEENSPLKTALSCLCLDTMDEYYLM